MATIIRVILIRNILLLCLVFTSLNYSGEADEPVVFLFGDSTLDVGTNNWLNGSLARVDKPYNGIDFPYSKATGRFSNGLNTADMIVKKFSNNYYNESPPSFLSLLNRMETFKRNLLDGVNFASGGSGILDRTGKKPFGEVVPLGEQIEQFSTACSNITDLVGQEKAQKLISNAVYLISVGSNDFFEYQNYYNNGTTPDEFMTTLRDAYGDHLKNLYNLGARKFGIISVPAIGCCPFERAFNGSDCSVEMNELAQSFYNLTEELLQSFSSEFKDVKYSLGNAYEMTMTILDNPLAFGFTDVKTPCCSNNGTFNFTELGLCTPSDNFCQNRKEYFFWDFYHPTEAASELAATTLLYSHGLRYTSPMNFSQLALININ